MGAAKEMWMADYERLCEEFEMGLIDEDDFRAGMKSLGMDPHEIQDHLDGFYAEKRR